MKFKAIVHRPCSTTTTLYQIHLPNVVDSRKFHLNTSVFLTLYYYFLPNFIPVAVVIAVVSQISLKDKKIKTL